jgi:2-oxoglutarate dehydrogenase E2 component (dihydrolipoamide succinyltransferase)
MSSEVKVPTLGESVAEATIGQWLKQPGEPVKLDEPIASLETDKVAVEVPAPAAGVMGAQQAKEGDTVQVGAVIATIEDSIGAGEETQVAERTEKAQPPASDTMPPRAQPAPAPAAALDSSTLSPAVRRAVLEHGIDPSRVKGSGKDGRLTKEDVLAAAQAKSAPVAAPAAAAPAPAEARAPAPSSTTGRTEERVKMTRMRQTIAKRLKSAQETAALLTTFNDCDMSAVMAARDRYKESFEKKHGVKLGFMSFFVRASIEALKAFPQINAEIDGEDVVFKHYYDIGVAVSGSRGLVVPVVRDADTLGLADLEKKIGDFGVRARNDKLTLAELQGGTFTISNGGIFGSMLSTPILNPPQTGILGMHNIVDRPVVRDGQIVIRPIMFVALTYDHRLVDGREAVQFLVRVKECIEDPERLLLDV